MPKTTICKEYTILGLYFGYAAVTLIFGLTVTLFDVLYILFLHSVLILWFILFLYISTNILEVAEELLQLVLM